MLDANVLNMNSVLTFVFMVLVCRFKAPGGVLRTSYYRRAWDFAKINILNLVPLTKEFLFPKEQFDLA